MRLNIVPDWRTTSGSSCCGCLHSYVLVDCLTLDSGDYFYKQVLEVSFTLYIAALGLINGHYNCGQDEKSIDGADVFYIHVYWWCIWVLYTCILMVCMGAIYMYIDYVYGCYLHVYWRCVWELHTCILIVYMGVIYMYID